MVLASFYSFILISFSSNILLCRFYFILFIHVRLFSPWRRSSQQFSTEIFMCSFIDGVTNERKEKDGEEIRRNVLVGHPDRGTPTSCH